MKGRDKMAIKKRTVDKWKKKKWVSVYAPAAFKEVYIGETPAEKEDLIKKRNIEVSVGELTGQRKFMPIVAKLRITNVSNSKAETELIGMRVDNSFLRRVIKRRRSKIDVITAIETKDNKKARLTATTVCRRKINQEKEKALRKAVKNELEKIASESNFDEFMQNTMFGSISQKALEKAKTITQAQRVEIVKARLLEGKER